MEKFSTRSASWMDKLTPQPNNGPLFVFDLDSTVTEGELLPLIARSAGMESEMTALTEEAMRGNVPFEQNFRMRVGLLRDVTVSQARAVAAGQPLHGRIAAFIRENPEKCLILTGNLDVWIEPILERLGMMERCICSRAVVHGEYVHDIAFIPDKGKVCSGLPRPFIAVGDGSNDIAMLKAADVGIAFGGARMLSENVIDAADVVMTDESELAAYLRSFLQE